MIKGKGPEITQLVKNFNFEGVWNELFNKNHFQRQSCAKYIENLLEFAKKVKVERKFKTGF